MVPLAWSAPAGPGGADWRLGAADWLEDGSLRFAAARGDSEDTADIAFFRNVRCNDGLPVATRLPVTASDGWLDGSTVASGTDVASATWLARLPRVIGDHA